MEPVKVDRNTGLNDFRLITSPRIQSEKVASVLLRIVPCAGVGICVAPNSGSLFLALDFQFLKSHRPHSKEKTNDRLSPAQCIQ